MSVRASRIRYLIPAILFLLGLPVQAGAVPFVGLFETDPGEPNNAALATYATLADLVALNPSSNTAFSITDGVSVSGLAFVKNVSNESAVPAPSVIWLLLPGMLGTLVVARRRPAGRSPA